MVTRGQFTDTQRKTSFLRFNLPDTFRQRQPTHDGNYTLKNLCKHKFNPAPLWQTLIVPVFSMSGKVIALDGRGWMKKASNFASTKTFSTKRNKQKLQLKKPQKLTQKKRRVCPFFFIATIRAIIRQNDKVSLFIYAKCCFFVHYLHNRTQKFVTKKFVALHYTL